MNKKDVESKMWVWNFCVSTFKHDRPCSKNEILENLGKYSNSTLQSVSFKKTSNKYFFTYATFFDNFLCLRSFKPTLHVWIRIDKYMVGSTSRSKILQPYSHQTERVWILSLYFDPFLNSETGILQEATEVVRDFKIFACPPIVWSELTNVWSLDPYLEAPSSAPMTGS